MRSREDFNRQLRRTAGITVALFACLVFGIIVLTTRDWIPGGIIVGATVVGLAREIPEIRRLCSTDVPSLPTRGKPTPR